MRREIYAKYQEVVRAEKLRATEPGGKSNRLFQPFYFIPHITTFLKQC